MRCNDSIDKRHVIRLRDSFDFCEHLCLVFECLEMNLRETLTRFGKNVGLSLAGVRLYARQLFLALSLLAKVNIVHADSKHI